MRFKQFKGLDLAKMNKSMTIREWIELTPNEDMKSRFMRAARSGSLNAKVSHYYSAINQGIGWASSIEGSSFWREYFLKYGGNFAANRT